MMSRCYHVADRSLCVYVATGQVAKICNNLALGIQMASVAEAMNLGVALGIEPKILQKCVDRCCVSSGDLHC